MAGTVEGGRKSAAKNKANFGEDWYATIAQLGGSVKGIKKGFGANVDFAAEMGKIGGKKSRRGKAGAPTSRSKRKPVECRYCYANDHLTYSCELREQMLAARRVRNEQNQENRSLMSKLAMKWAKK